MTFAGIVKSAGAATLLGIAVLALAGCGRRGDLETVSAPAPGTAAKSTKSTTIDSAGKQSKSNTQPVAPKRDFLLDPLL